MFTTEEFIASAYYTNPFETLSSDEANELAGNSSHAQTLA